MRTIDKVLEMTLELPSRKYVLELGKRYYDEIVSDFKEEFKGDVRIEKESDAKKHLEKYFNTKIVLSKKEDDEPKIRR